MSGVRLRVFDPRVGDDFVWKRGSDAFSSLREGFLVVDASGFDWIQLAEALDRLLGAASGSCFANVSPWQPGAGRTSALFAQVFPAAENIGGIWSVAGIACESLGSTILKLRASLGADSSGTWLLGKCRDPYRFSQLIRAIAASAMVPLDLAIALREETEIVLVLDEMRGSNLLVKGSELVQPACECLLQELRRRESESSR